MTTQEEIGSGRWLDNTCATRHWTQGTHIDQRVVHRAQEGAVLLGAQLALGNLVRKPLQLQLHAAQARSTQDEPKHAAIDPR